jgi:hypothetical protein
MGQVSGGPAVVVDPYSSGAFFAPAFRAAGIEPVALVSSPKPPDVYAGSYRPQDFGEIVTFTGDPGPAADRIRELGPRCILAGCESGVELTDLVAPLVNPSLANVPELSAARRHKGAMARAVEAAGLPTLRQICTADPGAVAAWIERDGLAGRDLVVKPPKSASTDSVVRVPAGEDWRQPFLAVLGATNRLGIVNDQVLVQEHAVGTELVVDTVSAGGRHSVTDICRYHKVDNGGHMAVYDSMEWMPYDRDRYGEVLDYAAGVLDAVGIRAGAGHIELMETPDGPRLIEVGARPHGGGHPRFCRVATGDSQVDRLVRWFAGDRDLPEGFTLHRHVCVVFFIARTGGIVRNAEVYERVRRLRTCYDAVIGVRTGDRVEATRDLFGTLDLGFAVLAGEDHGQVQADYEAVRAIEGELEIEPAEAPAGAR